MSEVGSFTTDAILASSAHVAMPRKRPTADLRPHVAKGQKAT